MGPIVCVKPRRRGFTLVELIVSIGVLAVLIGLCLPSLRTSRDRAVATKCQANLRSLGAMVLAYSIDYQDYYPTRVTDGPAISSRPDLWSAFTLQGQYLFGARMWRRYADASVEDATYRCPANRSRSTWRGFPWVDYMGVDSMYADPAYLHPDLPETSWRGRFGGRAQTLGGVTFPAAKVGLLEFWVWHGWKKSLVDPSNATDNLAWRPGLDRSATHWFLDGSVDARDPDDAMAGVTRGPEWVRYPVFLTAHGVRGRDFAR